MLALIKDHIKKLKGQNLEDKSVPKIGVLIREGEQQLKTLKKIKFKGEIMIKDIQNALLYKRKGNRKEVKKDHQYQLAKSYPSHHDHQTIMEEPSESISIGHFTTADAETWLDESYEAPKTHRVHKIQPKQWQTKDMIFLAREDRWKRNAEEKIRLEEEREIELEKIWEEVLARKGWRRAVTPPYPREHSPIHLPLLHTPRHPLPNMGAFTPPSFHRGAKTHRVRGSRKGIEGIDHGFGPLHGGDQSRFSSDYESSDCAAMTPPIRGGIDRGRRTPVTPIKPFVYMLIGGNQLIEAELRVSLDGIAMAAAGLSWEHLRSSTAGGPDYTCDLLLLCMDGEKSHMQPRSDSHTKNRSSGGGAFGLKMKYEAIQAFSKQTLRPPMLALVKNARKSEALLTSGADGVVARPFQVDDLRWAVARLAGRRRRELEANSKPRSPRKGHRRRSPRRSSLSYKPMMQQPQYSPAMPYVNLSPSSGPPPPSLVASPALTHVSSPPPNLVATPVFTHVPTSFSTSFPHNTPTLFPSVNPWGGQYEMPEAIHDKHEALSDDDTAEKVSIFHQLNKNRRPDPSRSSRKSIS